MSAGKGAMSSTVRWAMGRRAWIVGCVFLAALPACATDRGTWFCLHCGDLEERRKCAGITLSRSDSTAGDELESAQQYARWIAAAGLFESEHVWVPTGCHRRWNGVVACSTTVNDYRFFTLLPLVPDAELAHRLAARLIQADPAERRELLREFEQGTRDGVFERIARREPVTREEFAAGLEEWLVEHPSWR